MQVHTSTPPADPGEVLIERTITFRNSTFGALKSFIRAHKRRAGVTLTNSAAVDMLLRLQLAYHVHPAVTGEMLKMSRPAAAEALQAIPCRDAEEASETAAMGPESRASQQGTPTPATESARAVTINVRVSGPRSFVRREAA